MVPGTEDEATDPLFRGWAPSRRLKSFLLVSVGVILVVHPLVGGLPSALGLTGTIQYTAVEVQPDGSRLSFAGPSQAEYTAEAALGGESPLQIDCYPNGVSERCVMESQLTDGNLTVSTEPRGWRGFSYHGHFYRQVSTRDNETVTLGLQPVTARTVLANLSVPPTDWSQPIRTAVETGNVSVAHEPTLTGVVLSRNGSYYVVVPTSENSSDMPPHGLHATLSTILGVLLIQRGKRHYTHWRTAQ